MGHANVSNISEFFVKRLYAKGSLSMKECVEAMKTAGVTLRASEGEYEDEDMLALGLEQVVDFLRTAQQPYDSPVIAPDPKTTSDTQRKILVKWYIEGLDEAITDYDHPDSEYRILDDIRWIFAPGWRKRYKEVPILSHISN